MRCPMCSESVPDDARHCPHCLSELHPPSNEATTLPSNEPERLIEFPPGSDFSGRFVIIQRAGEGGMAVVYKARDKVLDQEVALKLIHPELGRTPAFVERFKREVRVTRQITHPNVCRIHDLGECSGLLYFSMEWIGGETLKELLGQAGRLDEGRALEIAEKIALALDAVHSKGVIHRDLKPGNVMIDDSGEVFVMDFGIATERGARELTAPGMVQGTPLYMAPEQRWGDAVDGRTDLYALGLILEEMLTGHSPQPQAQARARAGTLNGAIRGVLEKLLAHDPRGRFPSAGAAALALRDLRSRGALSAARPSAKEWVRRNQRSLWAAAGLALGAVVAAYLFQRPPGERPVSPQRTYYERGVHYLREESETQRSLDDAIHMFRRALGIDSTFALAWAGLGEAYWTRYDRFDRNKQASSRQEAERAVRRALALDPDLPEAHNASARGLIAEGDYRGAIRELKAALARNSRLDAAWVNMGRAHQGLGEYSDGLAALRRAVRLNPTSFRNYISLGNFLLRFQEYDEAEKAYRRATDLKPDSPLAWRNLGGSLLYQGMAEKAAYSLIQSLNLEENARSRTNLGFAYQYMKRYDQAAEQFRRATELEPVNPSPWSGLGDALTVLGKESEAKEAYGMAVRRGRDRMEAAPLDPSTHSDLATWCAKAGDIECALSEAARALAMRPEDVHVLFANALVRCIQGRDDEALGLLEKATKLGLGRAELVNDPALFRLHHDPRFQRILELAS